MFVIVGTLGSKHEESWQALQTEYRWRQQRTPPPLEPFFQADAKKFPMFAGLFHAESSPFASFPEKELATYASLVLQ